MCFILLICVKSFEYNTEKINHLLTSIRSVIDYALTEATIA